MEASTRTWTPKYFLGLLPFLLLSVAAICIGIFIPKEDHLRWGLECAVNWGLLFSGVYAFFVLFRWIYGAAGTRFVRWGCSAILVLIFLFSCLVVLLLMDFSAVFSLPEKKYYEDDTYILRKYTYDNYNIDCYTSLALYKKEGIMERYICNSIESAIPNFPTSVDIDSEYTALDSLEILQVLPISVGGDSIRYRYRFRGRDGTATIYIGNYY